VRWLLHIKYSVYHYANIKFGVVLFALSYNRRLTQVFSATTFPGLMLSYIKMIPMSSRCGEKILTFGGKEQFLYWVSLRRKIVWLMHHLQNNFWELHAPWKMGAQTFPESKATMCRQLIQNENIWLKDWFRAATWFMFFSKNAKRLVIPAS